MYKFSDLIVTVGRNHGGGRYNKAKSTISLYVTLLYHGLDDAGSVLCLFAAFSKFNPFYQFVQDFLDLGVYIGTFFRIVISLLTQILGMIMLSVFGICMLITAYAIVTLYLWTLVITPHVNGKHVYRDVYRSCLPSFIQDRMYTLFIQYSRNSRIKPHKS